MISVIIPLFNKEKYIEEVMRSIVAQTYKELEIIFIDDGSTDNSYKIAKSYANKKNIYAYRQPNSGVSVARNMGISKAHGEWIAFIDPDDSFSNNYFEELIKVSKNCDIICCCCYAVEGEKKYLNEFYNQDKVFNNENKVELIRQLLNDSYGRTGNINTAIGVPWGKLYKSDLIKKNCIYFNSKLRRQQDNAFNMHIFDVAKNIKYINKPLYFYSIENVKKFYKSKYDDYALTNAIELQREREDFFIKDHKYNDSITRSLFEDETVSILIGAFNKYLLNKKNNMSYLEKEKKYKYILSLDIFREIIENTSFRHINGLFHKCIFLCMKKKYYYPVNFFWKFRSIYEKLKFSN